MRILTTTTTTGVLAAAALLAGGTTGAIAATKPAAAKPAATSVANPAPATPGGKAEVENAVFNLKVIISGLESEKVPAAVKQTLVGCLYNNSLQKISASFDRVVAENPGKIDRTKPDVVLSVISRICGYDPATDGAAPTTPAAPATNSSPTTGR